MTAVDPAPTATAGRSIVASDDGAWWHLMTERTSYVVGVNDEGGLVQRYWGARIPDRAFRELTGPHRGRYNSSFQRPAEIDEQLPVDGGARWAIPSLQVRFAGGVRSLDLTLSGSRIGVGAPDTLCLELTDAGARFRVQLCYQLRPGTDVIERWVTLLNDDPGERVAVLRADSGNWLLPDRPDYRLSAVHGHLSGETQLSRAGLPFGELTLTSRQGTTGQTANPWMMIDDGSATERAGEVWSVALAWSGSWRLSAQRRPEGAMSITGGFGHDGLEWYLDPGASLSTPSTLGLYSPAGFGGASRGWHAYTRDHVLPHPDEVRPVLYNSWEATEFGVDEESQARLARIAASLGVEMFVMDDGWFGARRDDTAGLGDWHPSPDRFPRGLGHLVDTVHGLGLAFGLWVEPEMVNPDSELHRAHPEWALHWPGRPQTLRRNQLVLNFGRDDVRQWAEDWLIDLVRANRIDFLKWDMNRPFTEAGWPDNPGHPDAAWIEHTRGVYEVIDAVRAAHPALRVEACSSGGARADLGILAHTDQVWISDNTDALDRQTIQHGFSQLYPAIGMGAWVTDEVNTLTGRRVPLDYRFHVAMTGNLGIGADLTRWSDEERERAAAHIARYKQIRETVQHGEQYRLGGVPGQEGSGVEYLRGDEVVVFLYEAHRSLSAAPRHIRLEGLDPDALYRDDRTGAEHDGALLLERGLRFVPDATDRGWNNTRFSTPDYISSLTVLHRVEETR